MIELPNRFVVTGLPGAGKTHYVEARRHPGDVVWDFDRIADCMFQLPSHENRPAYVNELVGTLLFPVLSAVRCWSRESHQTFIILSDAVQAAKAAALISAKLITLVVSEDERNRRLKNRDGMCIRRPS